LADELSRTRVNAGGTRCRGRRFTLVDQAHGNALELFEQRGLADEMVRLGNRAQFGSI
jgi:hypothetical protein